MLYSIDIFYFTAIITYTYIVLRTYDPSFHPSVHCTVHSVHCEVCTAQYIRDRISNKATLKVCFLMLCYNIYYVV